MPEAQGGFLIRFDEEQRAEFLQDVDALEDGFSDALSRRDWPVRRWEVCGLMFEPDVVTHWALARKGKRVATGKVRVEFTEIAPTRILLAEMERRTLPQIRRNIVSARSGTGGRVPPVTWQQMKAAIGAVDASSKAAIERLELLRDQSAQVISRPGVNIVAQQRDAVGLALDVFDQTGKLRKRTLRGWNAPQGDRLTSFLDGLGGVRTIEDQLVARDAATFPGTENVRHTVVGSVFGLGGAGGRKLEVFNVNRTAIETSLGVDLIYLSESFRAWTLIQYKVMKDAGDGPERMTVFRPDASFDAELQRMKDFRATEPDTWAVENGLSAYRLCGDGFFFKLCSRVHLEVLSDALLPGMYLPRQFVEACLAELSGPRDGRVITFDNTERHISNTLFATLLRDAWIGTRGSSSDRLAAVVRDGLQKGRALVMARSRPQGVAADPNETLAGLGLSIPSEPAGAGGVIKA